MQIEGAGEDDLPLHVNLAQGDTERARGADRADLLAVNPTAPSNTPPGVMASPFFDDEIMWHSMAPSRREADTG